MQNRLLELLAKWATLLPDDLGQELGELLRRPPEEKELRDARRLFARALEAKGGLKIHTIHGFCERLLQRFPLESQVTPHFSVLDEREQALMCRAAFDATVARAAEEKGSALAQALATLIALTAGEYFRKWSTRCSASAPSSPAWWPIMAAATTGRRPKDGTEASVRRGGARRGGSDRGNLPVSSPMQRSTRLLAAFAVLRLEREDGQTG